MELNEDDRVFLTTWLMEIGTGWTNRKELRTKYHATSGAYYDSLSHSINELRELGYLVCDSRVFMVVRITQKAIDAIGE